MDLEFVLPMLEELSPQQAKQKLAGALDPNNPYAALTLADRRDIVDGLLACTSVSPRPLQQVLASPKKLSAKDQYRRKCIGERPTTPTAHDWVLFYHGTPGDPVGIIQHADQADNDELAELPTFDRCVGKYAIAAAFKPTKRQRDLEGDELKAKIMKATPLVEIAAADRANHSLGQSPETIRPALATAMQAIPRPAQPRAASTASTRRAPQSSRQTR
jgi:hypothetical protein